MLRETSRHMLSDTFKTAYLNRLILCFLYGRLIVDAHNSRVVSCVSCRREESLFPRRIRLQEVPGARRALLRFKGRRYPVCARCYHRRQRLRRLFAFQHGTPQKYVKKYYPPGP